MALALAAALAPMAVSAGGPVTVFAAASLKTALDEAAARFEEEAGIPVRLVYGGSSALARQIRYGAPAQLFISANTAWMDAVEAEGLLAAESRADLLGNRLALIASPDMAKLPGDGSGTLSPQIDLAGALGDGRLAMALVDAVPAGIYGQAALRSLGLWDAVAGRLAQTDDVRGALRLVASGEAPLGIVYATDAAEEPGIRTVGLFPADSHPPIRYPAAILSDGDAPEARELLAFLRGGEAASIFRAHGFITLEDGS